MSKWLISGDKRQFDADLAKEIGVNEAIVIQQIHYWLEINEKAGRNHHDGRYWTYNSLDKWVDTDFRFLSKSTLQRAISKLKNLGLLITGNYNKLPADRTIWYTLDYEKLDEMESASRGMTTPCGQNDHMVEPAVQVAVRQSLTKESPPENGRPHGMVNMNTPYGQNDHMHMVKMTTAIPETNTETTTETNGKGLAATPSSNQMVYQVIYLLNRPSVLRFILTENALNPKLNMTLRDVLTMNSQDRDPRFQVTDDAAKAIGVIETALQRRSIPVTPLHVATTVIQAYSSADENGRGKAMVNYIHRFGCGLTLRPFIAYGSNVTGNALVDEVLDSIDIVELAQFMDQNFINPTPEVLERQQEAKLYSQQLRERTQDRISLPDWKQAGIQDRKVASG